VSTAIPDFQSLSIVVADDSSYMRRIIRAILTGFGCRRIVEASDGADALENIVSIGPDLLLLDLVMPVLDGIEVMRMIRSPDTFAFPYLPVIMISAHSERRHILRATESGAHEFVRKPLSARTLYDRVASIVTCPREFIRTPTYFGPAPRNSVQKPRTPQPGYRDVRFEEVDVEGA